MLFFELGFGFLLVVTIILVLASIVCQYIKMKIDIIKKYFNIGKK